MFLFLCFPMIQPKIHLQCRPFFVFVRWLEATKHFLCNCNTCSLSLDPVRGFRCLGRLPVFLLGQWYDTPCTLVHPPKFNSSPLKIGPNPKGK